MPRALDDPLSANGRLYLDRRLPFLCVYRAPAERADPATERLVTSQSAYLVADASAAPDDVAALVGRTAARAAADFGASLVLDVWSAPIAGEGEAASPPTLQPAFRVLAPPEGPGRTAAAALARALRGMTLHGHPAEVRIVEDASPGPTDAASLAPSLPPAAALVGLEVAPVYRDAETGDVYPFLFETLRRRVGAALQTAAFAFACAHTSYDPPEPRALGRRVLDEVVRHVDRELTALGDGFDFLLQATPLNARVARAAFFEGHAERAPRFHYRPLPVDPELIKRRLFALPIEDVDDPLLASLFREKQEELDRQVTMLRERDTRRFFFGSLQLYGEVPDALHSLAEEVLDALPPPPPYGAPGEVDAAAFARRAAVECAEYRVDCPDFPGGAELRVDLPPGLLVSRGRLLVGEGTTLPAHRVEPLLQHEVGTHMVTYYNGCAQPLSLLRSGLAGYEALQEGLAVLAEYLVGGLGAGRLRVLAARVVAARCLVDGAGFVDVFRRLTRTYGFADETAWAVAMRTFRGGGFVKDVIYLRGLEEVLAYLRDGGDLLPLFAGKVALHHRAALDELRLRGVLLPAPLRPRFLDAEGAAERLVRARAGLTFVDLVDA